MIIIVESLFRALQIERRSMCCFFSTSSFLGNSLIPCWNQGIELEFEFNDVDDDSIFEHYISVLLNDSFSLYAFV